MSDTKKNKKRYNRVSKKYYEFMPKTYWQRKI